MGTLTRFELGMDGYMEPSENGDYVYADDAMAEINATQTALSLMNKTAEVMHKEITAAQGREYQDERPIGRYGVCR